MASNLKDDGSGRRGVTSGYEALRFEHGRLVVTAVARLGFGERPAFDVIDDLGPYHAEQRRFILSWLRFW